MPWSDYVKKEQYEVTKNDFGDEFIKRWEDTYNTYQWDTPHIAKATMHVVLGQIPSVKYMRYYTSSTRYEDGRVHVLWLQPSGTGKDGAHYFMSDTVPKIVANELNMKYMVPDEFTDAAMVGTYEYIKKYDKESRGFREEKIKINGWLSKGKIDIFSMPECSELFEASSQHKEGLMTRFQRAMDPIGRNKITKILSKTGDDPITVEPECSFFLTSYIPPSFTKRVTERGFVQRMITIINDIPISSRINAMIKAVDGLGAKNSDIEKMNHEVGYLANYMSLVHKRYNEIGTPKTDTNTMGNLKAVVYHVQDMIEKVPRYQQKEIAKFTNRCLSHAMKLSYHHAILRMSDKVEIDDISYAEEYLYPIWRKLIHHFEDALESDQKAVERENRETRWLNTAFQTLTNDGYGMDGWVFEHPLINTLSSMMRKNKDYVRRKIKSWVDANYLEKVTFKGHPMVKRIQNR